MGIQYYYNETNLELIIYSRMWSVNGTASYCVTGKREQITGLFYSQIYQNFYKNIYDIFINFIDRRKLKSILILWGTEFKRFYLIGCKDKLKWLWSSSRIKIKAFNLYSKLNYISMGEHTLFDKNLYNKI